MANEVPIIVDQGASFELLIDLDVDEGINLADFTFLGSFAKDRFTTNRVNFTITKEGHVVTLKLAAADTVNMDPGKYAYDVVMTGASAVVRLLEGQLILTPSITPLP